MTDQGGRPDAHTDRKPGNCTRPMGSKPLCDLQQTLGLQFGDASLLECALTHRSFLNENSAAEMKDNERLEFLGDAVLDFIVAEHLVRCFPDRQEGDLTSLRAALVRTETLAEFADQIRLGSYLRLGRGEAESGGRRRPALLCSGFEALMGAVFLDQGLDAVAKLVLSFVLPTIPNVLAEELDRDAKSQLQVWSQAQWHLTPRYRTVSERGPDHAKEFTVEVLIGETVHGQGQGTSKQSAEQAAAAAALATVEG
jgi:ribonuclease-3